jgi:DNA primase
LNHTRSDFPNQADIITLVEYFEKIYFTNAIKWICDVCGYPFYAGSQKEKIVDPCLVFLEEIESKKKGSIEELKELDERILLEYVQYPNVWFYDEGISLEVQELFEIGFCVRDERITIPIRDELNTLVGVKSRTVLDHIGLNIPKYLFQYPTPKSLILYGLSKAFSFIRECGECIVFESEKSVLKAFSMGIYNCVSIGGHEISQTQVMKLERLGVDIVIAFDKDVKPDQVVKEGNKFLLRERVSAIIDHKSKVLAEKASPVDQGYEVWNKLYTFDKYKIPANKE